MTIYSESVLIWSSRVHTSIDIKSDRKHSLKFRKMIETKEYTQAQDAEERRQKEAQSKRRYTF